MFHEHVPRPHRTGCERCASALRSAFLRLVRAWTQRQQKWSLPQCVTTTHPEPERRTDPVLSAYVLGSLNPCANCASPEHSMCDALGELRHVSAYRKRSLIRGGKKSCSWAWEGTGKTGGMDPTSPGLGRLFPLPARARVGPLSGCNPPPDRPEWQTLSVA